MHFQSALLYIALMFMFLVSMELMYTYYNFGFYYGFSSNRDPSSKQRGAFGLRIQRTLQNHVEGSVFSIPVLTVAAMTGLASPIAASAALAYVISRAAFIFLYYSGIPFLRVIPWTIGNLSLLLIIYLLFSSSAVPLL